MRTEPGYLARVADWSAWHAQPSLYVTALLVALAAFSGWAASAPAKSYAPSRG